jgi:hypothetical protein
MGYFNRTCSAGTQAGGGAKAGPALRTASGSKGWKKWEVTVVGKDGSGHDLVVFKTHRRSASGAKCIGNLVPEKADACMDARAHIHPPSSKSRYAWRLVPVPGLLNTYNIIAHVRSRRFSCLSQQPCPALAAAAHLTPMSTPPLCLPACRAAAPGACATWAPRALAPSRICRFSCTAPAAKR